MTEKITDQQEAALHDFLDTMYELYGQWQELGSEAQGSREVICTPCGGHYGMVAYWLVVINGSPPRGALLLDGSGDFEHNHPVYISDRDCSPPAPKLLNEGQLDDVRRFARNLLGLGPRRQSIDAVRPLVFQSRSYTSSYRETPEL